MKRKITISIALVLSIVLLSLIKSDSTVKSAPPQRFTADTGVVALGADQALQVFTSDINHDGIDPVVVSFRRMEYTQGACNGGVCRLAVCSQNTSAAMTLMPGEALSIAVDPSDPNVIYVRAVVVSNSRDARVNAMIIDTMTGEVVGIIAILIS